MLVPQQPTRAGRLTRAAGRAIQNTGRIIAESTKALTMRFRGAMTWGWSILPATGRDYAKEIGDGSNSNILMAVMLWLARNFPEAPIAVAEDQPDGTKERMPRHSMVELIRSPNPFYSGVVLWMATIVDFVMNGNAYWLMERNARLEPVRLWYTPSWMISPRWPQNGTEFLTHYLYKPNPLDEIRVDPSDVVHFRNGLDPNNVRLGLGVLKMLSREIFTDEEASNFTASVLANLGVPGVIIVPDAKGVKIDPDSAKTMKERFSHSFSGDNRGEPLLLNAPSKVTRLSMNMQELDMKTIRAIPESRVAALTGVPAAVVGFLAGLEQTKVGATMKELREQAYEGCIIPNHRILAADLDRQLLPEFGDERREHTIFDYSEVRVLQEDQKMLADRLDVGIQGGWIEVAEGRAAMGFEVRESDRVFLRSITVVERKEGEEAPPPQTLSERREAEGRVKGRGGFETKAHLAVGREARIDAAQTHIARVLRKMGVNAAEALIRESQGQGKSNGRGGIEFKATPASLLLRRDIDLLIDTMRGIQFTSASFGTQIAAAEAAVPAIDTGSVAFRRTVDELAGQITGIEAETKRLVGEHLAVGTERGYTTRQIAGGVPKDDFVGLADSFAFSDARAQRIARSTIAQAENKASAATWKESGVVFEVDILDGDGCGWTSHDDPDAAHGSRRSVTDFEDNPTAHPNCVRVGTPVVSTAVPS